ncbi:right-handed parallel beta-helix repeat-containing protein [Flavobacterium wongokense]|uniref:right-handed parallel beta-helix repeat-containing protein n=1 Tax=Flavobacterium wongokense TaxID=2910674 RepID=UPI001F1EE28B|nr:right-handed parallel beta-helix repeat-containing protein [Flavobacterium sp. WG47]MCF6132898.1 right-handed parallel beta-helix repeat-containing protein [Flavobacterium sp. WG47]
MRKLIILFFVGLAITVSSCRQDFVFEPSKGELVFSKDTIYLDTVFTNIGSSTYTLKVYNRSDKDIKIPSIRLAKGVGSKYRMTVDGMVGFENRVFRDVELLAKDSMYIFIETTAGIGDANPDDFLYTDQIEFDSGDNLQKVELVTLIQDAYFIFPNNTNGVIDQIPIGFGENGEVLETNGRNLSHNHPDNQDEYTFHTDKPYVVYGYASVPNGETLTIPQGARVHFHDGSGLVVQQGGTLNIEGDISTNQETLENEVIFEGDRLEPDFSDVPGQWQAVYLRQGSHANIKNLTLKNAIVGLLIEDNAGLVRIENTQIYDCSNYGILSYNGNIEGKKVVINSCGQYCVAAVYGGDYAFTNCTFNNNWSSSKQLAVYASDYLGEETPLALNAAFTNCIIYGSNSNEIILDKKGTTFNSSFQNCLVKINVSSGSVAVANPLLYDVLRLEQNGNKINKSPDFVEIAKNNLRLDEDSFAIGMGIEAGVLFDILGNPRVNPFDVGAYNFIP